MLEPSMNLDLVRVYVEVNLFGDLEPLEDDEEPPCISVHKLDTGNIFYPERQGFDHGITTDTHVPYIPVKISHKLLKAPDLFD